MSAALNHAHGLIVIAILAVFCLHIDSEKWSSEVSDVLYGRLDTNVTLACGSSQSRSGVEWRLNGSTTVAEWMVLGLDGSLMLVNTDRHMEGNYTCHDEKGDVIHTVMLRLGRVPVPLNVSCRMANHHVVRCFWKPQVNTYLPTKYIATYRDWDQDRVETCHQEPSKSNECTIRNPPTWRHSHIMNITEVNPLGSAMTRILLQFHKLLRPDPPETVIPEPVVGQPRKLRVSWKYPSSWPAERAFPLRFQVRYRPLGSNIWSERSTTSTTTVLTDVVSGLPHLIQVQAVDGLSYGSWSDWSPELLVLPWIVEASPTTEEEPAYEAFTETIVTDSPEPPPKELKSTGVLVSLGVLAGVILVTLCTLIILLWVRQKRRDGVTKQELASMMSMKCVRI